MRMKRMMCMVWACMLLIVSTAIPASAAEADITSPESFEINSVGSRATGSFNMTIPAKTKALANSSFPLAAWETVRIRASYSPESASVDFGLLSSDGTFYYFNVTDGIINETIQIEESGDYTLQIRNNSNVEIEVSGFVNY